MHDGQSMTLFTDRVTVYKYLWSVSNHLKNLHQTHPTVNDKSRFFMELWVLPLIIAFVFVVHMLARNEKHGTTSA